MMKSTNTKGFTLVELIIVITILAILATIAFISFQGYSKEARNSKRASDLNSIVRAIEIKTGADGVGIINFANNNDSAIAGGAALGWLTAVTDQTKYKAGDVNFTALGNVDSASFKDPLQGNYKIWVTSLAGGAYQLAGIKEEEGGKTAYVVGTYKARSATDSASGSISGEVLTLTNGFGLFKKGDVLGGGSEVVSVSTDLTRLTLSGTTTSGTNFTLANWESAWLVAWNNGTATGAVINGENYLPY